MDDFFSHPLFLKSLDLIIPEDNARAGWFVDALALQEVIDDLGITLNVKVKYMAAQRRRGTHRVKKKISFNGHIELYHSITLNQDRPREEVNKTLWHELAHALQSERWAARSTKYNHNTPARFHHAYKLAKGVHGQSYKGNRFEIHAEQVAEKNHHIAILKG